MKRLKLFPKIFIYTFLVMLFVTVIAHLFLYLFAPQMLINTNSVLENGVVIESNLNTGKFIEEAILKALPFSLAGCTVISFICSLLFSRATTIPIKNISKATEQMALLTKTAKCPVDSNDEIGTLALNVNTLYTSLLSTIENLEEEKKKVSEAEQSKVEFLRAASHELKTPVTAINVILENMILGVGKYKDRDTGLLECKKISARLSSMIKEVLDTSRIDFVKEIQNAEAFDLSETLPAFCEPYELIAKARKLEFQIKIVSECPLCLSKKSLSKILSNLFSNAVSYTKPGHKIFISLRSDQILVENECTPVPEEKLPLLFEPFYRPDFARDRKDGGNGLGLYIVDTLCKAMKLRYTFEPMDGPQGMRFTLFFHDEPLRGDGESS